MRVIAISKEEARGTTIRSLGLDDALFLPEYGEVVAAALRRAASFLCPTAPRALIDAVLETLNPLLAVPFDREAVAGVLQNLISVGDLLELADQSGSTRARLLYLGPPSYIERTPGEYLVTGVRPLGRALLSSDIVVENEAHTRTAHLDAVSADARFREAGLHKISPQQWVGQPALVSAHDYVRQFQQRLDVAPDAGSVDGLNIIDPSARADYYGGRWRGPRHGDAGDFVGRRPQAYGADRWCVVRLSDGMPIRLLDLPLRNEAPARDDAWRLQAAIDAERKAPLGYRTQPQVGASAEGGVVLDFFAPLPTWAERYLDLVGVPTAKSRGALFSYRIPFSAVSGVQSMLTGAMWMSNSDGEKL